MASYFDRLLYLPGVLMASPCKRMRLSADDDYENNVNDDSDDDKVVVAACAKTDDDDDDAESCVKVEVTTPRSTLTPASDDDDVKLTSEPDVKPSVVDLTTAAVAPPPRRLFAHTAEVIRARSADNYHY